MLELSEGIRRYDNFPVGTDEVVDRLRKHFKYNYKKKTELLPLLAIYAMYSCMMSEIGRYHGMMLHLDKSPNSDSLIRNGLGDIIILQGDNLYEAVEIKYEIPISASIVAEAMQKIKSESVERYLILSTRPPLDSDIQKIEELKLKFLRSNGCEIIVNGVYETIKYYLRLLKSTNDFIVRYTDLLGQDPDLDYEHRTVWNAICE